jgi:TolB-like protein
MKYILAILILGAMVFAQPAPQVAVFSFSTIGVDEATAKTATAIFRTELANTNKFVVVDADIIKTKIGNDDPVDGVLAAVEKAKTIGVSKAVIGSLSKLGEQTLVEVKLIDVISGMVEFSDRMGSMTGTDFDIILSRLAMGVAEKKKSEATAEVGKVIKKESEEPGRRASFITGSTRIGLLMPIGGFGDDAGVPIGGVVTANYETDKFMAEMAFPLYGLSGNAGLIAFEISAFKLMSVTDVCPYLGGGIGFGTASNSYYSANIAPVINFGGGIIFLRTYDFRFIADMRYRISFSKIKDSYYNWWTGYYYEESISNTQNSLSISFGLMYRRKSGSGCCLFF